MIPCVWRLRGGRPGCICIDESGFSFEATSLQVALEVRAAQACSSLEFIYACFVLAILALIGSSREDSSTASSPEAEHVSHQLETDRIHAKTCEMDQAFSMSSALA